MSEETLPLLGKQRARSCLDIAKISILALMAFLLVFLTASNMSLITTTQSTIADDLDAYESISWMVSSYIVASTSTLPLAGRFASIFSTRYCILVAGLVFAIGVLLSGLANTITVFLSGRVLSGASSGTFISASLIWILEIAPTKKRGLILGLQSLGFTAGVSFGGIFGGLAVEHGNWRAAYYLQAPVLCIAAAFVFYLSPEAKENNDVEKSPKASLTDSLRRIDYAGCVLLAVSTWLLLYSLSSPKLMLLPLLISGLLYAGFYCVERYWAKEPVIPTQLLSYVPLLLTCLSTMLQMAARWAVLFNAPTYCLAVLQLSPTQAGASLIPASLGFGLGGIIIGWLFIRKHESFYWSTLASLACFCLTYLLFDVLQPDTLLRWYIAAAFLNGLATGSTLNLSLANLLFVLDKESQAIGTALVATSRSLASTLAAAIFGGALQRSLHSFLVDGFQRHQHKIDYNLIRKIEGNPMLVRSLTGWQYEVARESYRGAIRHLIFIAGGIGVLAFACQCCTRRKDQQNESSNSTQA